MKTQEEIVAKFEEHRGKFLDFTPEVLLHYLDFSHAQAYLKPEATEEEWDKSKTALTRESVIEEMRQYMNSYGWDKAESHRGISAGRTIQKMQAWLWLLEDVDLYVFASDDKNYPQYGAPILKAICEKYRFIIPQEESIQRMMRGEPCGDDPDCGCGS